MYLISWLWFFLLDLDVVAIVERKRWLIIGFCMLKDWMILGEVSLFGSKSVLIEVEFHYLAFLKA